MALITEVVRPPRPVRKPEKFYQVFLGGIDTDYMSSSYGGYTGCLRGLSIGGRLYDFSSLSLSSTTGEISPVILHSSMDSN